MTYPDTRTSEPKKVDFAKRFVNLKQGKFGNLDVGKFRREYSEEALGVEAAEATAVEFIATSSCETD